MDLRHRYLPASGLKPGMVLAKPLVIIEYGRVLLRLPAGQTLTEAGIEQLLVHHAEYACVEVLEERSDAVRQAEEAAQEARLKQIFRFADLDSPDTCAFYNALLAYRKSR